MGAHGGQPFQSIKGFFLFSILRPVNDLGFPRDISA
jgi:hypothetical protein